MNSSTAKKFVDEITALRGVSVLLVMASHFGIPFAKSGFIGVDIFFVISGYLITSILLQEYNKSQADNDGIGTISIKSFYLRRIRRIAPASLTTLLVVYAYYQVFGNSIRKSQVSSDFMWSIAMFANNHFHNISTDYFAANSAQSPLLHYWSLSVEEQFYFVWPFLILSAINFHRIKFFNRYFRWPDRILLLALGVTISSFLFFFITFLKNPIAAYFLAGTRAWELGIGAIFAILAASKVRIFPRINLRHMHLISTLTLLLSLTFVSERNFGFTLLIPVFATGLFLYSTSLEINPSREWRGMICNRPLIYVGKISFSLYLWHFPIYIAFKEKWQNLSSVQLLLLICATSIISILSYKYIEAPFISGKFSARPKSKIEQDADNPRRDGKYKYPAIVVAIVLFISISPNVAQNLSSTINNSQTWTPPDLNELFPATTPENFSTFLDQSGDVISNEEGDGMNSAKWREIIQFSAKDGVVPPDSYKRLSEISQERSSYELKCYDGVPLPCTIYDPPNAKKTVLLLGDSRMLMLLPPIVNTFQRKGGWKVINWSLPGCPLIEFEDETQPTPDCVKRRTYMKENIKNVSPDLIIVSERLHEDVLYYKKQIELFKEIEILGKVLPIIPFGYLKNPPEACLSNDGSYRIDCFVTEKDTNRKLFLVSSVLKSAGIPSFNFQAMLCTASLVCPPVIENVYVYRDISHINPTFAEKLTDIINYSISNNSPVDLT